MTVRLSSNRRSRPGTPAATRIRSMTMACQWLAMIQVCVVVDRAVPFMEQAVKNDTPFLAVVWFNAPHEPIKAGPEYLAMYEGYGEAAHYYGCITELDVQVGRIRKHLRDWGVENNTLLCFCSDNGPEGKAPKGKKAGVTAGLRGRKRSLYDGGVRVPAIAEWPGKIEAGSVCDVPCSTLDYFPMVANMTGYQMPDDRPIDGQNLMPILCGQVKKRDKSIPFRARGNATLVKERYKLVLPAGELYDLSKDWSEESDIASGHPDRVEAMTKELAGYLNSMQKSHAGEDYGDPSFKPQDDWDALRKKRERSTREP